MWLLRYHQMFDVNTSGTFIKKKSKCWNIKVVVSNKTLAAMVLATRGELYFDITFFLKENRKNNKIMWMKMEMCRSAWVSKSGTANEAKKQEKIYIKKLEVDQIYSHHVLSSVFCIRKKKNSLRRSPIFCSFHSSPFTSSFFVNVSSCFFFFCLFTL